jgi:hypothetical protein
VATFPFPTTIAGDAHATVGLGAHGVEHGVVAGREVLVGDVAAQLDVAIEAELGVLGGLLVDPAHRLDVRVVRGHARADEPPRSGEAVEHVDLHAEVRVRLAPQQVPGRVEPGRP